MLKHIIREKHIPRHIKRGEDLVYDSRIYAWMEKRFDVPRSTFLIFAVLGFLLGLSTCGMFT